jgi:hypothetical protein
LSGVPPQLITAGDFITVRAALVRYLGGADAAILWSRIHFRLSPDFRGAAADDTGRLWWKASYDVLAIETGLSRDQVKRELKKLLERGHLVKRDGADRDRTSSYSTLVDTPHGAESPDEETGHRAESPDGEISHRAESPDGAEVDRAESPDGGGHRAESPAQRAESPDAPSIKKEEDISLFEQFWKVYPRKVDKPAAEKAWHQAHSFGFSPSAIISGAKRFAESTEVVGIDAQFIAKPRNWLDRQGWVNDYTPAKKPVDVTSIPIHRPRSWDDYDENGVLSERPAD